MRLPFGEYAPDLPTLLDLSGDSPLIYATLAKNVMPHMRGYKQMASMSAYSSALSAYCRGAFSARNNTGDVSTYAGDATKLYKLVNTTFTDVSAGGGYSLVSDAYWEFTKWKNYVIATSYSDNMQISTIGGASFAALSGTPPKARHIDVVRDFVVVGDTFDSVDGAVPYRVRWCGFGDETSWTVSASTQADYQDLAGDGGWVQAVVGGERGIIFQERAIWQMTYTGSPVVFTFDKTDRNRGALCSRGVIPVGNLVFYISDDGFYLYSGGSSEPIGANKVNKTFLADINSSYLHRVTGAVIPQNSIVIWAYPGTGSTNGTSNKCIMYNWVTKKWATAEFDSELIFRSLSTGVTLEGLDAISGSLDALTESLDSRAYMGGALQLGAFDTNHKLNFFTGSAMTATLETAEVEPTPGNRTEILEVRPIVDGGTHTVQIGTRERQADTVSWSAASSEGTDGMCPVRANSRYHRARVTITGGFTDATGVDVVKMAKVGKR